MSIQQKKFSEENKLIGICECKNTIKTEDDLEVAFGLWQTKGIEPFKSHPLFAIRADRVKSPHQFIKGWSECVKDPWRYVVVVSNDGGDTWEIEY